MSTPFIGVEAIHAGIFTPGAMRWNYVAVHPGVYVPKDAERTLALDTTAAWLWTGRRGVIAGRAAAALHGAKWVNASTPIEVIAEHTRPRPGIIVREERIDADEVTIIGRLPVTSAVRTALDLGRHLVRDAAVARLDALAAATGVSAADAIAPRSCPCSATRRKPPKPRSERTQISSPPRTPPAPLPDTGHLDAADRPESQQREPTSIPCWATPRPR